ncbi:uncharacterized protein YydD (DUF2326 family) [Paenibacillus sp. PvP094]|uniref:hypothetical protein n=1 Tax=Paenibacillus sp. PvP094 TaxID=3156394 RepID=UPI0033925AA3
MYLKELIISSYSEIIRKIEFHLGANLIVDETIGKSDLETGNNVGKTTVLALIDYCLGGGWGTNLHRSRNEKGNQLC